MTQNNQNFPGKIHTGNPEIDPSLGGQLRAQGQDSVAREDPPPVQEVTKEMYERIARRLIRYSTTKHSIDPLEPVTVKPTQFVDDLYDRKDLAATTWSTYRSALLWHLNNHRGEQIYQEGLARLNERGQISTGGEPVKAGRPKRKKSIPEADLHLLVEELTSISNKSKWAYRTIYWLMAGLATGLRPIEWGSARWFDDRHELLEVTNAKVKLGEPAFMRAQPEAQKEPWFGQPTGVLSGKPKERQIPVPNNNDRFFVEKHMALLKEQAEQGVDLTTYYEQCRRALWRACGRLWQGRKRYSLYTMRSQFSANQRATVGSDATAKLMGHSRPDSPSAAHYGKANQAHRGYAERKGAGHEQMAMAPSETPAQAVPAITAGDQASN